LRRYSTRQCRNIDPVYYDLIVTKCGGNSILF
jgi:hypothetical protein